MPNPNYQRTNLDVRRPRAYAELSFVHGHSRYEQAVLGSRSGGLGLKSGSLRGGLETLRAVKQDVKEVDSGHSLVHPVKREYEVVSSAVAPPETRHCSSRLPSASVPSLEPPWAWMRSAAEIS